MKTIFHTDKPVIGMVHFLPLPDSPLYDPEGGIQQILRSAQNDADILVRSGFDGIIFSNEGDRPYLRSVSKHTCALMSRLIFQIVSNFDIPFGVSVLADPEAAISVGSAVEATFVRTFLSWVYVADWGIVDPDAGKLQRLKNHLHANKLKIFANISGHSTPLSPRSIADIAKGAVFFGLADAICLAGTTAGAEVSEENILQAKQGVKNIPVIIGTGVTPNNLERMLEIGDGVIVGTSLKYEEKTFKAIDPERVKVFMKRVREIRERLK